MVFQVPAIVSVTIDCGIVVAYFLAPQLFMDPEFGFVEDLKTANSMFWIKNGFVFAVAFAISEPVSYFVDKIAIITSEISVLCQFMCLRHLTTTASSFVDDSSNLDDLRSSSAVAQSHTNYFFREHAKPLVEVLFEVSAKTSNENENDIFSDEKKFDAREMIIYLPQIVMILCLKRDSRCGVTRALKTRLVELCGDCNYISLKIHCALSAFCIDNLKFDQGIVQILELEISQLNSQMTKQSGHGTSVTFWNEMDKMCRRLLILDKILRNEILRRELLEFVSKYIVAPGQGEVLVPTLSRSHRVVNIHVDECFAFASKQRAPVLLCLEIVAKITTPSSTAMSQNAGGDASNSWWSYTQRQLQTLRRMSFSPSKIARARAPQRPCRSRYQVVPDEEAGGDSDWCNVCEKGDGVDVGDVDDAAMQALSSRRRSFNDHYDRSDARAIAAQLLASKRSRAISGSLLGQWSTPGFDWCDSGKTKNQSKPDAHAVVLKENLFDLSPSQQQFTIRESSSIRKPNESASVTLMPVTELVEQEHCSLISSSLNDENNDNDAHEDQVLFKERWSQKENRIRQKSSCGKMAGWQLLAVIVKTGDDLRQEQLISQCIRQMNDLLVAAKINCWLKPYDIIAISPDSGIIEAIPDTVSLDALYQSYQAPKNRRKFSLLRDFYYSYYADSESEDVCSGDRVTLEVALQNFVRSLAGYSVACYLLQIKDRHNGNILLDNVGHLIHIDFGFILGTTPGGNLGFEQAPFKLTADMVNLLGGQGSALFATYRKSFVKTFMELRSHHREIMMALELLARGCGQLPCFRTASTSKVLEAMRLRFQPHIHDEAAKEFASNLVNQSLDNWTTTCYDRYQRCCSGIF